MWLIAAAVAGVAHAQSDKPWDGAYGGIAIGAARHPGCVQATLEEPASSLPGAGVLEDLRCSSTALLGGVQLGNEWQVRRLVVGVSAEMDASSGSDRRRMIRNPASVPEPGTYVYSGRLDPGGFAIGGGRIGYAGDLWLPYLRAGAVFALRPRDRELTVTPLGSLKSTVAFSEEAGYAPTGWASGAGADIGLNGAWSISAEVLHVMLGRRAQPGSTCAGSPAACAAFSGMFLETRQGRYAGNLLRIGVNHWFGYWDP